MNLLPLVTRAEWGAERALGRVPLKHPVDVVVLSYNPGVQPCYDQEECIRTMKRLQEKHLELGLLDVHYNFVVGGDGLIYEGRGWHFQSSKSPETPDSHGRRIDIGYMGDLDVDPFQPPHVLVPPPLRLIHFGINKKYIRAIYDIKEDQNPIKRQSTEDNDVNVL